MKKVVLIGNAPLEHDLSDFVDSCDCVVRFNACRNYRIHSGAKSDVLFLNNAGNPRSQATLAFLLRKRTREKVAKELPYTRASQIFFVRPSAAFCKSFLEQYIPEDNPLRKQQLHDLEVHRDLGREIVAALFLHDKKVTFIDPGFYVAVWKKLQRYGKTEAIMPSTGILGLEMLLHCASFARYEKYIAGFRFEGWPGHPWELERRLLNDYVERRVIVPLDNSGCHVQLAPPLFSISNPPKDHASERSISRLFFVANLQIDALRAVRKKYPSSRSVYWDSRQLDQVAMRRVAELSQHLVAEEEIADEVSRVLDRPITAIPRFDPSLARRWRQNKLPVDPGTSPPYPVNGGPVLFCPINDTHVKTFAPIRRLVGDSRFLLYGDHPGEKAAEMLESLGIEYDRGGAESIARIRPSVVVLGKDWSPAARDLISAARMLRIPNVCVQEGPTEFDRDGRMRRCDFPLVQGPVMLKHLDQSVYFLTGNARFETSREVPLPGKPMAMLNCNFWGRAAEREQWLNDVIQVCQDLKVDFFISRHPRDKGPLPDWPIRLSNPAVIQRHLEESTLVITQYSSVIYEALFMGRNVVCHNPRAGEIPAFDEDPSRTFAKTYRRDELARAIQWGLTPPSVEQRARIETFLDWHCGSRDSKTAERCASVIAAVSWKANPLPKSILGWLQPRYRLSHAFDWMRRAAL
jgi:hypothetical protein